MKSEYFPCSFSVLCKAKLIDKTKTDYDVTHNDTIDFSQIAINLVTFPKEIELRQALHLKPLSHKYKLDLLFFV